MPNLKSFKNFYTANNHAWWILLCVLTQHKHNEYFLLIFYEKYISLNSIFIYRQMWRNVKNTGYESVYNLSFPSLFYLKSKEFQLVLNRPYKSSSQTYILCIFGLHRHLCMLNKLVSWSDWIPWRAQPLEQGVGT